MAANPRPNVLWAQDNEKIFLKVDLKEVKEPLIDVTENDIKFKGVGVGAGGQQLYEFTLNFYDIIIPKKSEYRVNARSVEFKVIKDGAYFWPRLTEQEKRPTWLKIDFDRWRDEDESEEDDLKPPFPLSDPNIAIKELEEKLKNDSDLAWKEVKKIYLFIYNLFQFIGFFIVGFILVDGFSDQTTDTFANLFDRAGGILAICQIVAVLEIVHPAVGLVKTGISAPLMQIYGRNFLIFFVIIPESNLHGQPAVYYLMVVWTFIELIRYPFYALSSIGKEKEMLTWLRYTIWIPLYPLGFLLEALVLYQAIPMYENSGKWSPSLPNGYNFSWNFPLWLWCDIGLRIFIGAPILLRHMHKMRMKKLGGGSKKKVS